MKRIFLLSQASEVMKSVSKTIKVGSDNRLICIKTSIERKKTESLDWYVKDRQSLVDNGFEVTDYTLTGKNLAELTNDLRDYKYIYVSGGDVAWLIEQSYRSGFNVLINELVTKRDVVYIGSSAGGIVCGPSIPPYYEINKEYFKEEPVRGFGLVEFTTVPHWGRSDKGDVYLSQRLPMINNETYQPFILLNDYQYIYVEGKHYQIEDVRRLITE